MKNHKSNIIMHDVTIREFLEKIQQTKAKVLYVVDVSHCLIGSVTEGDYRRFILRNNKLPLSINDIINLEPRYFAKKDFKNGKLHIHDMNRGEIPILDENQKICGFYPNNYKFRTNTNNPDKVLSIAPTRISFAGGGSDVDYWFEKNLGCVVNLAIAKYARVSISRNYSDKVHINSLNTGEKIELHISELNKYKKNKLNLVISCLKRCNIQEGLNIEIFCDFETGTGLGGSSSLVAALLKGIAKLFNYSLTNMELINLAYDVERVDAKINGGWQDQIVTVNGGLCVSNFSPMGFRTYKIDLNQRYHDYLNSSLFISRIGEERKSSEIHEHQKNMASNKTYSDKMKKIVNLANECVDLIGQEKIDLLGKILHEGWLLKKDLGKFISNQLVNNRYDLLIENGAMGGRLLGAGGAGFILIYVDPNKQHDFIKKCKADNIPIERIQIDLEGVRTL